MNKFTGLLTAGLLAASMATSAFGATTTAPTSTSTTAQPQTNAAQASSPQKASPRHASMPRKHVEAIQTALNNNGEKVAVDGKLGPKTRGAIKDFQQKHGITPTGHADAATLKQLNVTQM